MEGGERLTTGSGLSECSVTLQGGVEFMQRGRQKEREEREGEEKDGRLKRDCGRLRGKEGEELRRRQTDKTETERERGEERH